MDIDALASVDRFRRYLETERRASRHTVSAYDLDLAALVAFCDREGIKRWDAVGVPQVRTFAARSHGGGLSPSSVQRRLSAVRTFMRYLIRERVIRANPAREVQAPRTARRLPALLDVDQMAGLLNIKETDPYAVRDKAMMELLYSSALRLAELLGLDLADLDLTDRTARVLGKGNAERIVPVGSFAKQAIRAWLPLRRKIARPGETALFVGRGGGRLGRRDVQVRVALWARRQGIAVKVHPHMFRHSCATHLLEGSGDIRAVQEFLGHASISTTQIYTHLDFAHIARVYDLTHPRARRRKESRDEGDIRGQRGGDRSALWRRRDHGAALETRSDANPEVG